MDEKQYKVCDLSWPDPLGNNMCKNNLCDLCCANANIVFKKDFVGLKIEKCFVKCQEAFWPNKDE